MWFVRFFSDILNNLTFKKKITYMFLPVIIIPILFLAILSSNITSNALIEKAINNSTSELILISKQDDMLMDNIERSIKMLSTNQQLQDAIVNNERSDSDSAINLRSIANTVIFNYLNIGSYIDKAELITENGEIYKTDNDMIAYDKEINNSDAYVKAISHQQSVLWTDIHENIDSENLKSDSAINVTKAIVDIKRGNTIGVISIDIKEDTFAGLFKDIGNKSSGEIFIVNRNGNIVAALDKNKLFSSIKDEEYFKWAIRSKNSGKLFKINNKEMVVTSCPIKRFNWFIISISSKDEITAGNKRIIATIIIIGFICVILTIIVSFIIARTVTSPITRFVNFIRHVSYGNLDAEVKINSKDEIGLLAASFNNMIRDIRILIAKNDMEQKKKREYELSLLQSQVNPHFLYNTMESIRSLIIKGANKEAFEVVSELGNFYKKVLSKGRDIILLNEEIELTINYLNLQKIKFGDLLVFNIELDEKISNCKIPKLTLQPIVENSIFHGFKDIHGQGVIDIKGYERDGTAIIQICDNGIGIREEIIEKIFANSDTESKFTSFGLKNISDRIRLNFGEPYGIEVSLSSSCGTKVRINIPFNP